MPQSGAILGTLLGVVVGGLTPMGQPSFWLVHVARQEGRVDHAVSHHLMSLAAKDWKTAALADLGGPMTSDKAKDDFFKREGKNRAERVDIQAEVSEVTYRRAYVTLDNTIVHRKAGCQSLTH